MTNTFKLYVRIPKRNYYNIVSLSLEVLNMVFRSYEYRCNYQVSILSTFYGYYFKDFSNLYYLIYSNISIL